MNKCIQAEGPAAKFKNAVIEKAVKYFNISQLLLLLTITNIKYIIIV